MDERIARLKTSKDALAFAANARRKGEGDLEKEALQKGRELQAVEEGFQTPAERAIGEALLTFEEEQGKLKGRKYRANRTRKMLKDHTPLIAAERMVLKARPSEGYRVLKETGNQGLSFEAILDRYPEEFSGEAVRAARARLAGESDSPKIAKVSVEVRRASPVKPDSLALRFLSEFSNSPPANFRVQWLPGYQETSREVASALQVNAYESLFDLIWKTKNNYVANAGEPSFIWNSNTCK